MSHFNDSKMVVLWTLLLSMWINHNQASQFNNMTIDFTLSNLIVKMNSPITITCKAEDLDSDYKVMIFQSSKPIKVCKESSSNKVVCMVLIEEAMLSDAEMYSCVIQNKGISYVSEFIPLTVIKMGEKVVKELTSITENKVTLSCDVFTNFYGIESIVWVYDGEEVASCTAPLSKCTYTVNKEDATNLDKFHCKGVIYPFNTKVDGQWNAWEKWLPCPVSCKLDINTVITQYRYRQCDNPKAENGGKHCVGDKSEGKACYELKICPVDGGWGSWENWSQCSSSCRIDGEQPPYKMKSRKCNKPEPQYDGKECDGIDEVRAPCENLLFCSIDGGFGEWSTWSACSTTCNKKNLPSKKMKTRECNKPLPLHGGKPCNGDFEEHADCTELSNCPINGAWGIWTEWSSCSPSCKLEGGENPKKSKTRQCNHPAPEFGGLKCKGEEEEITICENIIFCPIDGGFGDWSMWSACSPTCNKNELLSSKMKSRKCDNPLPLHGGKQCIGEFEEHAHCSEIKECTTDGGWSNWESWTTCSATCTDKGVQQIKSKYRKCDTPIPIHGGKICPGDFKETKPCDEIKKCPVDGGWSEWSQFTACSASCNKDDAEAFKSRNRQCNNPIPENDGIDCEGQDKETVKCTQLPSCPINGKWSDWSPFSQCSLTCNTKELISEKMRERKCNNPLPALNGKPCAGLNIETEKCSNIPNCPIDGMWSDWTQFSKCSASCNKLDQIAVKFKTRQCNSPRPEHSGKHCSGEDKIELQCTELKQCPIDGGWSDWTEYSTCSATCSKPHIIEFKSRSRLCDNPPPEHNGQHCLGDVMEKIECTELLNCPIDGGWTDWTKFSKCSATCNGDFDLAFKSRSRECNSPQPENNGKPCYGKDTEREDCTELTKCPIDGGWSDWTEFSQCSASCKSGINTASKSKSRQCNNPTPKHNGKTCPGDEIESVDCNELVMCPIHGSWGDWTEFSTCSPSCNENDAIATKFKTRSCNNPKPEHNGQNCKGQDIIAMKCNDISQCPIDGVWGSWTEFSICSASCNAIDVPASKSKTRKCDNPPPKYNGVTCPGNEIERADCTELVMCPINGGWSNWIEFSKCSATCKDDNVVTKSLKRQCNSPKPLYKGKPCDGEDIQTLECIDLVHCPINGGWSDWSHFSECSMTCNTPTNIASKSKTRKCNNPPPKFNGMTCQGNQLQSESCYDLPKCPTSHKKKDLHVKKASNVKKASHAKKASKSKDAINSPILVQKRSLTPDESQNDQKVDVHASASIQCITDDSDVIKSLIYFKSDLIQNCKSVDSCEHQIQSATKENGGMYKCVSINKERKLKFVKSINLLVTGGEKVPDSGPGDKGSGEGGEKVPDSSPGDKGSGEGDKGSGEGGEKVPDSGPGDKGSGEGDKGSGEDDNGSAEGAKTGGNGTNVDEGSSSSEGGNGTNVDKSSSLTDDNQKKCINNFPTKRQCTAGTLD